MVITEGLLRLEYAMFAANIFFAINIFNFFKEFFVNWKICNEFIILIKDHIILQPTRFLCFLVLETSNILYGV